MKRNFAAVLTLSASLVLPALTGCESTYEDRRPDPTALHVGEKGLQSKDLIEMTDRLAADIVQIPEIAQSPTKITIVMTGIDNKMESQPSRDMTIYLARMRAKLNMYARDRVMFVEQRATTERLQNQEGATPPADPFGEGSRGFNNAPPAPGRLLPQYALKGVFYEQRNGRSRYFLCTFQLTRIGANATAGGIFWENSYETKTVD